MSNMETIIRDNQVWLEEADARLQDVTQALLLVDPHPSEKARLNRLYKGLRDAQTAINELLGNVPTEA